MSTDQTMTVEGSGDQRPKKGCWAPGNYVNHCVICTKQFIGDKRAYSCAPCAYEDESKAKPHPNYFSPPFTYDEMTGYVMDSDSRIVLEVRGWGYLTGTGGKQLAEEVAVILQDQFGHHIANLLTNDHPKHKTT